VIFDRHAKLPIDAGSVPFSTDAISLQRSGSLPRRRQGSAEHSTVTLTSVRAMGPAVPALSEQVLPAQLAVQLHCHGPTAIDETSPARKWESNVQQTGRAEVSYHRVCIGEGKARDRPDHVGRTWRAHKGTAVTRRAPI
jgi:hypothetical protein